MGQDENPDVAALAPHARILSQPSHSVNYGEALFLCFGQFSILVELWTLDRHDQHSAQ
jgi:hypothetical protein